MIESLPKNPTSAQLEAWYRSLVRYIGFGFHPDTPIREYYNFTTGLRIFPHNTAAIHQRGLNLAFAQLDVYAIGVDEFEKMKGGAT